MVDSEDMNFPMNEPIDDAVKPWITSRMAGSLTSGTMRPDWGNAGNRSTEAMSC